MSFSHFLCKRLLHSTHPHVWLSSACLQIVSDAVGWGFVVRGNRPCHIQAVEPQGPAALAGMKVSVTGHVATEGSPVTTKAVRSRGRSYCCEFMHQISWYCAEEIQLNCTVLLFVPQHGDGLAKSNSVKELMLIWAEDTWKSLYFLSRVLICRFASLWFQSTASTFLIWTTGQSAIWSLLGPELWWWK